MKITIESTSKIVEVEHRGQVLPARLWEGETDGGIPVHCFVTRIAVAREADTSQFERELQECKPPSAKLDAVYPSRLVIG